MMSLRRGLLIVLLLLAFPAAAVAQSPGDKVTYVTGTTTRTGTLLLETSTLDLIARSGTTSTQDQVAPGVVQPVATPTPTPTPTPTSTPAPTPTPSPTATPTATPTPTPASVPRGIWAEAHHTTDTQLDQLKAMGYSFVYVNAWRSDAIAQLDRVAAHGLRAVVWLGKWYDDNDSTPCAGWQHTDAEVTSAVNLVKDHPATAYYFVDDEPHAGCAGTREAFQARNAVIKAVDPNHPTFLTEDRTAAFATLANTTDILAAVGYPCNWGNLNTGCSLTNIPGRIQAAVDAGVQHLWAVPQVFEEPQSCAGYYRYPSASEYTALHDQWWAAGSPVEGEFAFGGSPGVYSCYTGLLENPGLWDAVTAGNPG